MKVLVIGANLPALIIARQLTYDPAVHEIAVVGSMQDTRAAAGLGPIFLWDSEAVRMYMHDLALTSWKFIQQIPSHHKEVRWNKVEDIPGYHKKLGKPGVTTPPCRGVRSFNVVSGGMDFLGKNLARWISGASLCRLIDGRVIGLDYDGEKYNVDYKINQEPKRETFDVVLNCVPRAVFERLFRGAMIEWDEQIAYFHTSLIAPDGWENEKNALIYDGQAGVDWHRCSFDVQRRAWIYETMKESAFIPGSKGCVQQGAKLPRGVTELPRHPKVVHCGRWAELDGELMVSDVIEKAVHYVDRLKYHA